MAHSENIADPSMECDIDLDTFNELKALLDADFAGFVVEFISDTERRIESIAVSVQRADFLSAAALAHSLKGSALNLGASGMARHCYAIEHAVKSRAATDTSMALETVLAELQSNWLATRSFMQQQT